MTASMPRGSITFWLLNDFEKNWQYQTATLLAMRCPLLRQAVCPILPIEAEPTPAPIP